jgi:diacylglycerol O-acyltransferase / wax synthase
LKRISPLDHAWLLLESRDTPMHVGGLLEFTLPDDAPDDFLSESLANAHSQKTVPQPWNLKLVDGPIVGHRLPLMVEERDIDLEYHVRHSALPHPGGQRELGVLVSRLHSTPLDLRRPLWELHTIEGLEGNRFAVYIKMHHSLIDGVSGMRMLLRSLSPDPNERGMGPFWTVGSQQKPKREPEHRPAGPLDALAGKAIGAANAAVGLGKAGVELGMAAVDEGGLSAPYAAPTSPLGGHITGQRRFATQHYELEHLKDLARASGATLNDIVLYLSSSALRRYLAEHGRFPTRSLTAGIPVNLRDPDDQSAGTAIGLIVAELGTDIADPQERLEAIKKSVAEAKRHQREIPKAARTPYTLLVNTPYMASLIAGFGGHAPIPFNVTISNVPGPPEQLYFNGARLDCCFPLSLLLHGNALNITCMSYAGTLNFGFTGARDTLPHLQRLAIYMRDSVDELEKLVNPIDRAKAGRKAASSARKANPSRKATARKGSSNGRKAASKKPAAKKAPAKKPAAAKGGSKPRARAGGGKAS